jgi:hypothetical protein
LIEVTEQLSVGIGSGQVTTRVHWPDGIATVMFDGHEITGAVTSRTTILKAQLQALPDGSWALQTTVVVPTAKLDPDAGEHVTETCAACDEPPVQFPVIGRKPLFCGPNVNK